MTESRSVDHSDDVPTPMTWVDVARRLATLEPASLEWKLRPDHLLRVQVDWSGVVLELRSNRAKTATLRWLELLFPRRIISDGHESRLLIDGPPHASELPIQFELREDLDLPNRIFLGSVEPMIDFSELKLPDREPLSLIACHSVKGGTGRTTLAVAIAKSWHQSTRKPILLVDADLEAPGLSYLFRQTRTETRIALEDVLALAHSDTSEGYKETIKYAAARLADHRIDDGILVLPLRRDLDELASSSIRAEHLSTSEHPFALAKLLNDLALSAGCAGAVVDLRAGLVPLSAQFLLDPSVARVFSTSLSGQSLEATAALFKFLAREFRRAKYAFPTPLLVVNRVPSVLRETGADDTLLRPVLDRMTADILLGHDQEVGPEQTVLSDEIDISPWRLVKVPEISDLQVTSATWAGFSNQIDSSGFLRFLSDQLALWLEQEVEAGTASRETPRIEPSRIPNTTARRAQLQDFANRLVAAETADTPVETPLVTGPLAALANQFSSQLPIIVSEGAKGTGKTLTARFLVNKGTWTSAVLSLAHQRPTIDAQIIPVLGSIQTSEAFQKEIDQQRSAASQSLGFKNYQRIDQTKALLIEKLAKAKDRVAVWLDAIAWSSGFQIGEAGAGERFLKHLVETEKHVLALVEGVEEMYSDPFAGHTPDILRSLLVDLPLRLRGEPGRPIGLVVFARRDSVDAAVRQNRDQFRITYKDFELSWSDDDVLELAAWLATKANSAQIWSDTFRSLPQSEKERKLEVLWGRKLGPDDRPGRRTAEAYTAAWVIAALSDLQGRLVARDLVRFLANAASFVPTSQEEEQYRNRLLVPRALRQAIRPTSIAKVQETEEEIHELKAVFSKFKRRKKDIRAPIDEAAIKSLSLRRPDIELLRRHAILFGEAPPYEVPELFRMGLNLRHSGARHSVINLRRKARQRLGIQT